MYELLEEVERAVDAGLWQLAVTGALIVPDVAAALRDPSGQTSSKRYRRWWNDCLAIAYDGYLSADDAYRYRCALTHQNIGMHPKADTNRVLFMPPQSATVHKVLMSRGPGNSAVALDIRAFVADVVGVARGWLKANEQDPHVANNLQRSVRLHQQGIPPFIVGAPLVG